MEQPQQRFFRRPPPSSPDACRIWNECCLPEIIEVTDIYWALDTWARLNCLIEMRGDRPYVFWTSPSGVRHECFADTFAHWVLCACEEIKPQAQVVALPPQPLTPNGEITPTWTLESIAEEKEEDAKNEINFHETRHPEDGEFAVVHDAFHETRHPEDGDALHDAFHETRNSEDDDALHDVEKIDDSADNIMIQTLKDSEPLPLTFDEILQMNLESFLAEEEELTKEH